MLHASVTEHIQRNQMELLFQDLLRQLEQVPGRSLPQHVA